MEREIDAAIRKTRLHLFEDGIGEIVTGAFFLLLGVLFIAETLLRTQRVFVGVSAMGLPILALIQMTLSRIIRGAKERYAYPRTGYVAYPRLTMIRKVISLAFGAIMAIVIVAIRSRKIDLHYWLLDDGILTLQGLLTGGILIFLALSIGLIRFFIEAALIIACGAFLTLANVDRILGYGLFFGITGLIIMIAGGMTFRRFIRQAPSDSEGESE